MVKILLSGAALMGVLAGSASYAAAPAGNHAKVAKSEARGEVQTRVSGMFAKLDTNRDGFITDSEIGALRAQRAAKVEQRAEQRAKNFDPAKMFAAIDANKDGRITQTEVQAKMSARKTAKGKNPAAANDGVARMFARVDTNKDGAITLAELSAAPRPEMPTVRKAGMNRGLGMLQAADTNKDGKVSKAEVEALALTQFDRADTNRDGKITAEERKAERQMLRAQHKPS